MNILGARLQNFFCHQNTVLELPPRGIVLVTGNNGSGKSALIESVSVACWGKTLRKSDPWAASDCVSKCVVETSDRLLVTRAHEKTKTSLAWAYRGKVTKYETVTKSQEALENIVGTWDVWRRCSVFASHDAAHFSNATDAERKHLLESLLGLSQFDSALCACKLWLRQVEQIVARVSHELSSLEQSLTWQQQRLESAKERAAQVALLEPAFDNCDEQKEKVRSLKAMAQSAVKEQSSLETLSRKAKEREAEERFEVRRIRDIMDALSANGRCPTCGQAVSAELQSSMCQEIVAHEHAANVLAANAEVELGELQCLSDELRSEIDTIASRAHMLELHIARMQSAQDAWHQSCAIRIQASTDVLDAEKRIGIAIADVVVVRAQLQELSADLATASACELVLGLRGVRAAVLARTLASVERLSNVWLRKLFPRDVRLELESYTTKKSGGIIDSIGLRLSGAGTAVYAGLSGGERRRVDLALILALGLLAGEPGTMFFDELFDSLDDDGVDRANLALQELACNRCVLVVSHAIAAKLHCDLRLHVENGVIK